jgi:hypothetical protein
MTQQVDVGAVRRAITVAASQRRAFEVFTAQLGRWWPKEYSIGSAAMADFVLEPKIGGRDELGVDGTEYETGRVIAFEPPDRLALACISTPTGSTTPTPRMPAKSRSDSSPTGRRERRSSSNTAPSSGTAERHWGSRCRRQPAGLDLLPRAVRHAGRRLTRLPLRG